MKLNRQLELSNKNSIKPMVNSNRAFLPFFNNCLRVAVFKKEFCFLKNETAVRCLNSLESLLDRYSGTG